MPHQNNNQLEKVIDRFLQIIHTKEEYLSDESKHELVELNQQCKSAGGGCLFEGFRVKKPIFNKHKR